MIDYYVLSQICLASIIPYIRVVVFFHAFRVCWQNTGTNSAEIPAVLGELRRHSPGSENLRVTSLVYLDYLVYLFYLSVLVKWDYIEYIEYLVYLYTYIYWCRLKSDLKGHKEVPQASGTLDAWRSRFVEESFQELAAVWSVQAAQIQDRFCSKKHQGHHCGGRLEAALCRAKGLRGTAVVAEPVGLVIALKSTQTVPNVPVRSKVRTTVLSRLSKC